MSDTLLWWIGVGYDAPYMIAEAVKNGGLEPEQMASYWNKARAYPGVYGTVGFAADRRDGYPDNEVIMCEANSLKEGAFNLAPGYGAA
jgi:branched-chain amino acid transport system substrate-binding protein